VAWSRSAARGLAEHLAAADIATYRPTGAYRDNETDIVLDAVPVMTPMTTF
jgi:hypothetical protein